MISCVRRSLSSGVAMSNFADILHDVEYRDWEFVLGDGDRWLQIRFRDSDGNPQHGRKWRLSPHMTRSEFVQTALMAVLAAEEHEAREQFHFRGRAVFGPHIDVEGLWEQCRKTDARK